MKRDKSYRMVELAKDLLAGRVLTTKELSDRWGVSIRSVERDLSDLRDMRLLNLRWKNGEIFLENSHGLQVNQQLLYLPDHQKKELVVLLKLAESNLMDIFGESLEDCKNRILSSMRRSEFTRGYEERARIYQILGQRSDFIRKEVVQELEIAMIDHHPITLWYLHAKTGSKQQFDMEPYRFVYAGSHWYLFAHKIEETHPYTALWKLGRIETVEVHTEEQFSMPNAQEIQTELDSIWTNHYSSKRYPMKVWFSQEIATYVTDTVRHPTESKTPQEDGSLIYEVTISGWKEFMWWVLIWGKDAKILEPEWIRRKLVAHAEGILSHNLPDQEEFPDTAPDSEGGASPENEIA